MDGYWKKPLGKKLLEKVFRVPLYPPQLYNHIIAERKMCFQGEIGGYVHGNLTIRKESNAKLQFVKPL